MFLDSWVSKPYKVVSHRLWKKKNIEIMNYIIQAELTEIEAGL